MTVINADARSALTAGRLGHLATLNPDGSPQVSLVWIGMDGDEIVSADLGPGIKYPPFDNPPPGQIIRISAARLGGVGPWSDTG